jgi:hypothetical protein
MKTKRFVIRKSLLKKEADEESSEELSKKIQEAKKAYAKFVGSSKALAVSKPIKTKRISAAKIEIPAVQCEGITQSSVRCNNKTKNPSGYCHHH